jgi:prepilin-type N-terminal cleavage/methylation domain-containing protein
MKYERRTSQGGFTLIELLVTISIIVILVGVLTLALVSARTSAKVAETQSRLSALSAATVRFKADIGYYPAVLNVERGLDFFPNAGDQNFFPAFPPADIENYREEIQEWYSFTSPAEFLLGYGDRAEDGYGRLPSDYDDQDECDASKDEMPRFGIRHPSLDGVWRATDFYTEQDTPGEGYLDDREPSTRGRLYGPYLEIENEQMLGRIKIDSSTDEPMTDPVTGHIKIFYPGDPDYDLTAPLVIVDSWGSPIRYYRPIYPSPSNSVSPQMGITRTFPPSSLYDRPTLSDYFVLRPYTFKTNEAVDGTLPDFMEGLNSPSGDTSTTLKLQIGQFAYFSPGPDQSFNQNIRADYIGQPDNDDENATDQTNFDNLVEVGP